MKINLGSGWEKLPGYTNVDQCNNPDINYDLSNFPWPFRDDSADEIFSSNFLEHVDNPIKTILEMHRILKPGGIVKFIVPYRNAPLAPTIFHRSFWSYSSTVHLFDGHGEYKFGGKKLFETRYCKHRMTPKTKMFEFVPNSMKKIWDYLNLPGYELEYLGVKIQE